MSDLWEEAMNLSNIKVKRMKKCWVAACGMIMAVELVFVALSLSGSGWDDYPLALTMCLHLIYRNLRNGSIIIFSLRLCWRSTSYWTPDLRLRCMAGAGSTPRLGAGLGFWNCTTPTPPHPTPPLPQPNLNLNLLVGGELLCLVSLPSRLVSRLVSPVSHLL